MAERNGNRSILGRTSKEAPREENPKSQHLVFSDLQKRNLTAAHRPFNGTPLQSIQVVFAPLHQSCHWALVVGYPASRRVECYDSLGRSHKTQLYQLYYTLFREAKMQKLQWNQNEWTLKDTRANVPHQTNGSD